MITVELKHIPAGSPIFDGIHEAASVSHIFGVVATYIRIVLHHENAFASLAQAVFLGLKADRAANCFHKISSSLPM